MLTPPSGDFPIPLLIGGLFLLFILTGDLPITLLLFVFVFNTDAGDLPAIPEREKKTLNHFCVIFTTQNSLQRFI